MATLGFIGTGNMGSALAKAACNVLPSDQIFLANRTPSKAQLLAEELECRVTDNEAIAEYADLIFLGVKPQMMSELLDEISPVLKKRESRFILVSMAAGLTIERIQELAGGSYPVIRIMPNTPAAVGAGMILYCANQAVTQQMIDDMLSSMVAAGRFDAIAEVVGKIVNILAPIFHLLIRFRCV